MYYRFNLILRGEIPLSEVKCHSNGQIPLPAPKSFPGVKYYSHAKIPASGTKFTVGYGTSHKTHWHWVNFYIWPLKYLLVWPKYSLFWQKMTGGDFSHLPPQHWVFGSHSWYFSQIPVVHSSVSGFYTKILFEQQMISGTNCWLPSRKAFNI